MKAILVAGLGWGDEGKGQTVDYLARSNKAGLVVRYNGGAQAGHNVVCGGRHHTFSQFGSASFIPAVRTFLSRFMLVDPFAMENEAAHLKQIGVPDVFARTYVDPEALLITPYHKLANRLKEMGRKKRHGSCGMGIGETMNYSLRYSVAAPRVGDLRNLPKLAEKLERLQAVKCLEISDALEDDANCSPDDLAKFETDLRAFQSDSLLGRCLDRYKRLADLLQIGRWEPLPTNFTIIFEGAQGVLLDQDYGFPPHNTWTDCTFKNALRLLGESRFTGEIERIGVVRPYATRHGAGPFVTERDPQDLPADPYNPYGEWQGRFRVGDFDAVATRYALAVIGGVDKIMMTCCDQVARIEQLALVSSYHLPGALTELFVSDGENVSEIRRALPTTQEWQARLTGELSRAQRGETCQYAMDVPGGFRRFRECVSRQLSFAPITPLPVELY